MIGTVAVQLALPGIVVPTCRVRRYRPAVGTGRRTTGRAVQLVLPFPPGTERLAVWQTGPMRNDERRAGGGVAAGNWLLGIAVVLVVIGVVLLVAPGPSFLLVGLGVLVGVAGLAVRVLAGAGGVSRRS